MNYDDSINPIAEDEDCSRLLGDVALTPELDGWRQ